VFLLKQDSTRTIDVGLDLATNPTGADDLMLYTDYDRARLLGCVLTDAAGDFIEFTQTKETFIWTTIVDEAAANPSDGPRTEYTLAVPPYKVEVLINMMYRVDTTPGGANRVISMEVSDLDSSDGAVVLEDGRANIACGSNLNAHSDGTGGQFRVITSADSKIGVRTSNTSIDFFEIGTSGWKHLGLHAPLADDAYL
jgi:hypothetical protein